MKAGPTIATYPCLQAGVAIGAELTVVTALQAKTFPHFLIGPSRSELQRRYFEDFGEGLLILDP